MLVKDLELMLHTGSSAYRLADDHKSLTRRVDATTTEAFTFAASAACQQSQRRFCIRTNPGRVAHVVWCYPEPSKRI